MTAEPRPTRGFSTARLLSLAAGVIALDQLAKIVVLSRMQPGDTVPLLPGLFQFRFIVNRGGLFGIFRDLPDLWRTVLFTGVPVLASAGLLFFLLRTPATQVLLRSGLALILGGAIGNLTDRLRLGFVVDYLDVFFRGHHWPAFNVADSAICIGVGLILLDAFHHRPSESEGVPSGSSRAEPREVEEPRQQA
jgi:signal peptidase II